jgi:PmbA protein
MEQLVSLALRQSQQAEVYETHGESTLVHFEANRVKQIERRQSHNTALRLVRDGRMGFASASGETSGTRLVDMAVQTSAFGAPARFAFPGLQQWPSLNLYDERVASIETAALIGIGLNIIERVRARQADVLCEGLVAASKVRVRIANSAGLDASYPLTAISVSMEGMRVNGTDMLFIGDSKRSAWLLEDTDSVARTMLLQLDRAAGSASIRTGTFPVLFTPHGVDVALLLPLAVAFNGKNVLEKASRLAGRQGEAVFDSGLTLWDDSTLEGRPTSAPFDAEGSPSRPLCLIESGVVGEFLYDLQTATEAGTQSTGSGRRMDARSPVRPGMSAFWFEPGKKTFDEMLSSIDNGLVVEELIGAGQGNLLAGDFGGNVLLGYKVEKGEIVGRVKDTMIAGNILDVLSRNVVVGSDSRWVDGHLWTPSILCDGVSVSAKGGAA